MSEAKEYPWQEGIAQSSNIVTFDGDDIHGVGQIDNDVQRRRAIACFNAMAGIADPAGLLDLADKLRFLLAQRPRHPYGECTVRGDAYCAECQWTREYDSARGTPSVAQPPAKGEVGNG